jgi:hypothetical protein
MMIVGITKTTIPATIDVNNTTLGKDGPDGRRGRDRMAVLPVLSVRIPNGEVYSIQQYMIKFVSDLRQVGDFHRFPPPIK